MEDKENESTSDLIAELVRLKGNEVLIHTQDCVTWGLTHPNCVGCKSELGCAKTVRIMLLMTIPDMYPPKDFEDFSKMHQRISDLQERILKARTPEEVQEIPSM